MYVKKRKFSKPLESAFSLVELLLAISIIGMLATLAHPAIENARQRAEHGQCVSNLRQLGAAVVQEATDRGNRYPVVETNPRAPIYGPDDGAISLRDLAEAQGLGPRILRCQSDARQDDYFSDRETSYEWFPFVDGEPLAAPRIYVGAAILLLPPQRIPLLADYKKVHHGRQNVLFADGHISAYSGEDVREAVWDAVTNGR